MATARLDKSYIETYAHTNVLTYLDNRTYVKDPKSPSSTLADRQFIYESDPLDKSVNFSGFPYIILGFPTLEYSKESVRGKTKDISFKQMIIVRTAKDGNSNARTGAGRSDMLAICDDLNETFNSETVKATFRLLNMFNLKLTKESTDSIVVSQLDVFESVYSLTYDCRMVVST